MEFRQWLRQNPGKTFDDWVPDGLSTQPVEEETPSLAPPPPAPEIEVVPKRKRGRPRKVKPEVTDGDGE